MTLPPPHHCELAPGARAELVPLARAEDGEAARWPTRVQLGWDRDLLHVRFECEDDDAWSTLAVRDAPLWTEEVVEVFLAPGAETPTRYFELEISPRGVVFDAEVFCPHGDRRGLAVDSGWTCEGLGVRVSPGASRQDWIAELSIPWRAVAPAPLPELWRINFYRIERPRDGSAAEFSAWSPTLVDPADFHRPERFGHLRLLRQRPLRSN